MSKDGFAERRLRAMTASRLLREGLKAIEAPELAKVIGVPVATVERWAVGEAAMSFVEKIATAMAILTLAPTGSELFRQAATLRSQLAASLEFESGVTSATSAPPLARF